MGTIEQKAGCVTRLADGVEARDMDLTSRCF
jgi:hypothetical protein